MSHWPQASSLPVHQMTVGPYSACGSYGSVGLTGAIVSAAVGSAFAMLTWPFSLSRPMMVRTAFWMNGASVTGQDIKVGIYGVAPGKADDGQPVKLAESASTAATPVNAIQSVSIGPIYLVPGMYHVAIINDAASWELFRTQDFTGTEHRHLGQWTQNQASHALPATLTTGHSKTFNSSLVLFGLATQTVI